MTITTTAVSGDFDDETYDLISGFEGSRTDFYLDSEKIPTVGVGVALIVKSGGTFVRLSDGELSGLFSGIYSFSSDEKTTLESIATYLNSSNLSSATSTFNTAKGNGQFVDLDSGDIRDLYDSALDHVLVSVRSNQFDFSSLESVWAGTKELKALYSMAYNSPALIGDGLMGAIEDGDRARAWYEILYNHQNYAESGAMNRRASEANLFGLTNSGASAEAVMKELNTLFNGIDDGSHDIYTRIHERDTLKPFETQIADYLATVKSAYTGGNAVDFIQFADGNWIETGGTINAKAADGKTEENTSNLIIGGDGDDSINALGGDDHLHGGEGADILNGGEGTDTAYYTEPGGSPTQGYIEIHLGSFDDADFKVLDRYGDLDKLVSIEKIVAPDNASSTIEIEGGGTVKNISGESLEWKGQKIEIENFHEIQTDDNNYHLEFKFLDLDIRLGSGNDTVKVAGGGPGIIYTGGGEDEVKISVFGAAQAYIADASTDDRFSLFGYELTGGIKNHVDESPWATYGSMLYGINQYGELVIRNALLAGETFISNFVNQVEDATANIFVGEYFGDAARIFEDFDYGLSLWGTINNLRITICSINHIVNGSFDPLVLDLDDDGIETTALANFAPQFDLTADGFAERVGWIHSDDAFVAVDLNDNDKIDDITELFGSETVSGFTALSAYDSNTDGKVDVSDTDFADILIWRDLDQDGVTDDGELQTLTEAGIKSINVTPDSTTPDEQAGNIIAATGTFTWDDNSTGTSADVLLQPRGYDSVWLEDVEITVGALALPDLQGHGTLPGLRAAMSFDGGFLTIVDDAMDSFDTHNLADLRMALLPVMTAWMDTVEIPSGSPGYDTHPDVAVLSTDDPLAGPQISDYAIKVVDGGGTYYILASGDDVLDAEEEVIERPSWGQVLAQDGWTTLPGEMIQFFERWTGLHIPIGLEGNETGTEAVTAVTDILNTFSAEMNRMAVEIAGQGPLAGIFEGLSYDATTDRIVSTTTAQLEPFFRNIIEDSGSPSALEEWSPFVGVLLTNFDRPNGLEITFSYLMQNVVAAWENADTPAMTLTQAAVSLGIPDEQIITGSGTMNGTEDNDLFYMDGGNQTAIGGENADAYIFGRDFGDDIISDTDSGSGHAETDTIRFAHLNADDVTMYRNGVDLLIEVNGETDSITVEDQFMYRLPGLFGGYQQEDKGINEIIFADGTVWTRLDIAQAVSHPAGTNDELVGTGRIDYLDGGEGDDKMTGGNEGDLYVFGAGYGHDQIADATSSAIGLENENDAAYSLLIKTPDILYLKDLNLEDVQFVRDGDSNDLTISVIGESDDITISDQFDLSYTGVFGNIWFDRIEGVVFADNTSLSWDEIMPMMVADAKTSGNDEIYGFSWEDTLDGGAGDDYLSGGDEDDVYIFGRGYGHDTIFENVDNISSGWYDRLEFTADVLPSDIVIERGTGVDDLVLRIDDTDETVTILNATKQYAFGSNFNEVEDFVFANSTVWDVNDLQEMYLEQQTTSGNDEIIGFMRDDIIVGGDGDDVLEGRGGGDTYIFETGHGDDVIYDYIGYITWDDPDTIDFQDGIVQADVEFAKVGQDLLITYTGAGDSITVEKFFSSLDMYRIENFHFSDDSSLTDTDVMTLVFGTAPFVGTSGADTLTGNAGDNLLQGLAGNDTLNADDGNDLLDGGDGNDTLNGNEGDDSYAASNGADIIHDIGGTDTIVFGPDVALEDLTITRVYNTATFQDLLITWGDGNSILVDDHYNVSRDWQVETLKFDDDTTVDLMLDIAPVTYGTSSGETIYGEDDAGYNHNDVIYGLAGNDTIYGDNGNDTLIGGEGNDVVEGYKGDDIYVYEAGNDSYDDFSSTGPDDDDEIRFAIDVDAGDLTFSRSGSYDMLIEIAGYGTITIADQFNSGYYSRIETAVFEDDSYISLLGRQIETRGTSGNDTLNGDLANASANDIMYGYAGNDTIDGNTGNDLIYGGADTDTLSGSDGNDEIYGDAGTDTLNGNNDNDTLHGGADADTLNGGSGTDTLYGDGGNDTLNGGTGVDTLVGGTGDDTYAVDDSSDVVTENSSEGTDLVQSTASAYTISSNVENLTLTGNSNISGTGNSGVNTLTGNSGNNTLDGGAGADSLIGGSGNDTYVIDDAGDSITEGASAGTDTVQSGLTYTLGTNLENLTLTGSSNINGTGNTVANTINGNSGNNTLSGDTGNDTINGNGGNDTLDGGTGNDDMSGGTGDDIYVVDSTSDTVSELTGEGTDTVQSGVAWTLNNHVENLTLTGSSNINGTGNSLNNTITGNSGNNTLSGSTGADSLIGGAGDDTYTVDDTGDTVTENASEGTDQVNSSVSFTLSANVENITLTGGSAVNATGNSMNNTITGNSGANTLDGGAGVDSMTGGSGNDIYVVDDAGDSVTEGASAGTDTVQSYITYTLGSNLENLTLLGSSNINGTGTTGNNTLTGNSGVNTLTGDAGTDTLDGGAGADTLVGGTGNDTYVVDDAGDVVTENSSEGTDLIQASVSYTIAANVETLTLTGSGNINATGNSSNNDLNGNSGNNTINGGAGNDDMRGGAGDDTYVVDSTSDSITESASSGTDTVQSSVTWTLGSNVENLALTGSSNVNATGNSLDNILTGNSGNNTLKGGAGNDIYFSSGGLDTIDELNNGGTETLIITGGTTINDITTSQVSNNAKIVITASTNEITINNQHHANTGNHIERIQFDDGFSTTLEDHLSWNWGTSGGDTITGTSSHDTIIGKAGGDTLSGGNGDDDIHGGAGADTLHGGSGADLLHGGVDNDILYGEDGLDTLFGGTGADTFIFEAATAYNNIDVVKDFSTGQTDVLDLHDVLSGYTPGVDVLTNFLEITDNSGNSIVKVDRDGTGVTYGWTQIATLEGITGLTDEASLVISGNLIVH